MDRTEKVKILVQEIRDQELEIRHQLRTSTQTASLSVVVLALAGTYFANIVSIAAFCVLPLFLNVAALSNLNTAIDVAHQAIIRDWLQRWANEELGGSVFLVGQLTSYRRLSMSGIAVNSMAAIILLSAWTLGIIVAVGTPWFWYQIAGTAVLVALTILAAWDYATIRRRTEKALASFTPSFAAGGGLQSIRELRASRRRRRPQGLVRSMARRAANSGGPAAQR